MRTRLIQAILALTIAVGLAACGGQAPSQTFGKEDVAQVRKIVQDFVTAYNAKDLAKIGTFYAGNAALMPANRSTLRGPEAIKGYYDGRFQEGATNLVIEPLDVEGQGTLGYVAATFSFDIRSDPPVHDRGKVLWIVRKFGGQWKFEYQIMSSDLPPGAGAK
jgi:ketosteroid isomerase-like protein